MAQTPTNTLRENLKRFKGLFADFNDDEISLLSSATQPIQLKAQQYLFYEGTSSDNLYLLLSGKVCVEKDGQMLTMVDSGTYFGEISLLDNKPRSASVYAVSQSKLLALNVQQLREAQPQLYAKLVVNLAKSLPEIVRKTSETATTSLRNEMTLLQQQNEMGQFLSYIMVVLSIFIVAIRYTQEFNGAIHEATYIRLTLVLCFIVSVLAIKNKQSFAQLGLNLMNARRSLWDAAWYTLLVVIVTIIFKWFWIQRYPELNEPLFKISEHHSTTQLFIVLAYFLYSPLQEYIARGCIQSSFAKFFKGRYATLRSIVVSNLLFCSFYSNLNLKFALLLFVLGLGWGWLYSRNATLLGVAISHAFLGVWIGVVLGLPVELR